MTTDRESAVSGPVDPASWCAPRQHPPLQRGELHVWRVDLPLEGDIQDDVLDGLSPDERERANRFRFPEHRSAFAATRVTLRRLLGGYLGVTPQSVTFEYGAFGKPELTGRPLRFNVAHTRGLALIAVATDAAVGIDVEMLRPEFPGEEIADQCFAPAEAHMLRALPGHERAAAFFARWTLKEAYVKALGVGLGHDLRAFSVTLDAREPPRLCGTDHPERWTLAALNPAVGYTAAVAVCAPSVRISRWTWDAALFTSSGPPR